MLPRLLLDYSRMAKTTYVERYSAKRLCNIPYHFIEQCPMNNTRPDSISDFVSAASSHGFYLFILTQNLHLKNHWEA